MGFGHRIYRVRDPRAEVLKRVAAELAVERGASNRLHFAEAIEAAALRLLTRPTRRRGSCETNVEFYTALVLEALAFPRDAFTAVFAAGRVHRLDGPCPGAGGRRAHHPAAVALHRPDAAISAFGSIDHQAAADAFRHPPL